MKNLILFQPNVLKKGMIVKMDIEEIKRNANNKEFMIKAVSEQGKYLEYASSELKDDIDVVKTALNQDGESLEFVSDYLE